MTNVFEAEQLIRKHLPAQDIETIALQTAVERILGADITAERDLPAYDRVTMDGIAIDYDKFSAGQREFIVAATQAAGREPLSINDDTHCVRVMTGAVLPHGTNTIIPIERITLSGNIATINSDANVAPRQFVHHKGTDHRAGKTVLQRGQRIGPTEMAVLASIGAAQPPVCTLPRIGIVATGDELVAIDEPVASHQIRSSNDLAIEAAIRRHHCGITSTTRIRDEPTTLLETLESIHNQNDVLVLSGGVSMGDFDFVPDVLKRLGAEVIFHRIAQKPGRPMWFGISKAGKPIFALPGNPVSTLVCTARYLIPALQQMIGIDTNARETVQLANIPNGGPKSFTWFVPVKLSLDDGICRAHAKAINTSGDFISLAATDGIVELDANPSLRRAGEITPFYRW